MAWKIAALHLIIQMLKAPAAVEPPLLPKTLGAV
jgi:hypothetical protein